MRPFNPSSVARLLVRAPNWVGDAVMSWLAIQAIREHFRSAELIVVARPWVADVYRREPVVDRVIAYEARHWRDRVAFARRLRGERIDCAILLQNAFDAAMMAWLADIPERIGYSRDGRGWLLTRPIAVPEPGEIPRHERFYYLELLRRAGILEGYPASECIRLTRPDRAIAPGASSLIGVSPGAAYGNAKRWLPERFAQAAVQVARARGASLLLFGSAGERHLAEAVAEQVRAAGIEATNLAGSTTLTEFLEAAAACSLFLTNDSGAMHIASALGIPTVAVFGATDDTTTGPTGPLARVVRDYAECSPCLLRDCPIDHRCMTAVTVDRVTDAALELWTADAKL
jgi:heptosyltransferase-2